MSYENIEMHHSIAIKDLRRYVDEEQQHIKSEYQKLVQLSKPKESDDELSDEEEDHCYDYIDVYPVDQVLLDRQGKAGSDIFNASYVNGFAEKKRCFIAAQGPLSSTLDDFWLMIWQQKPCAIVMLTNLVKDGKVVCERYWPIDTDRQRKFRDIKVTLNSCDKRADFTVRHLKVEKDEQTRSIMQFHYTSWISDKPPANIVSLVNFYKKVTAVVDRAGAPLLVHDSVDGGKAGTFIAMENLLTQARIEKKVNFYECVRLIRSNIPSMVQTEDQYMFLYLAVREYLETSEYSYFAFGLETKIAEFEELAIYSDPNELVTTEFEHIETMFPKSPESKVLEKPVRRKSNLYANAPTLRTRPRGIAAKKEQRLKLLKPVTYADKAVFTDGYRAKDLFIATHFPAITEFQDFWQMMIQQNVGVIAQLGAIEDKDAFYPVEDTDALAMDDDITLERVDCTDSNDMTKIFLKLTAGEKTRQVTVLHMKRWFENDELPPSDSLLHYINELMEAQEHSRDENICIVDADKVENCGLLICACNSVDNLNAEQRVDIYSSVVTAKLRCPQFIPTLEQYVYLYTLLNEYRNGRTD